MTIRELETLKKFIHGNNSFHNEIKNKKITKVNNSVKFELIIIYAILNKKYLLELNEIELLEIICSQDFTIEERFLVYKSKCISLESLIKIVNNVENYKAEKNHGKIIPITKHNSSKDYPKHHNNDKKCKIYNFTALKNDTYFTMRERSYIFENELNLDKQTIPYTEEVRKSFTELLNYLIINLLNEDNNEYNIVHLKVLYSYLNLYPFTIYLKDKINIPYEILSLPQNAIGLRKTTYNNKYISELEYKMIILEKNRRAIKYRKKSLEEGNKTISSEVVKLQRRIFDIESEILSLSLGIYLLKTTPEIYNENLINYISSSFLQGNVEINKLFENPLIKLFYLKNQKVEFHCTMRLDTLMNLVNSEQLLKMLDEGKKLKKEV